MRVWLLGFFVASSTLVSVMVSAQPDPVVTDITFQSPPVAGVANLATLQWRNVGSSNYRDVTVVPGGSMPPSHGTLPIVSEGSFIDASEPGFVGGDTCRCRLSDGISESNEATVDLQIARPEVRAGAIRRRSRGPSYPFMEHTPPPNLLPVTPSGGISEMVRRPRAPSTRCMPMPTMGPALSPSR